MSLTFSACGSDDSSPDAADTPTPTPAAGTPTPEPESEATTESTPADDDEAELEALFIAYWDAVADLWNDPRLDPEVLAEVATDGRNETMLTYVHSELITNDAHRDGEPAFGEVTVAVDGDTAVMEACFDQSEWKLIANNREVPVDLSEVRPSVVTAIKVDDNWLVDDVLDHEEASITC